MGCAASISTRISTSLSSDTIGASIGTSRYPSNSSGDGARRARAWFRTRRARQSPQTRADSPAPAAASKLAMYSTLPLFFHVAGGKLGYQFLKLRAVSGGAGQLLPEHLFAPGCLQLGKLAGEGLRPGR